jgi:hypothetical protein
MSDGFEHGILRAGQGKPSIVANWWWVKAPVLILMASYLGSTAVRAVWSAFDNGRFPEALLVKVELLPLIFPLHMATGGLALLLVPLALVLRGTSFHKLAGRVAAVDVFVAGVTAIPVALTAPVTGLAAAGFATQGLVWLGLLAKGIYHIRRGERRKHQSAMLMMAAVTSGALFFRVYLALWAIYGSGRNLTSFYGVDSWLAWALPLAGVAWLVSRPSRAARP